MWKICVGSQQETYEGYNEMGKWRWIVSYSNTVTRLKLSLLYGTDMWHQQNTVVQLNQATRLTYDSLELQWGETSGHICFGTFFSPCDGVGLREVIPSVLYWNLLLAGKTSCYYHCEIYMLIVENQADAALLEGCQCLFLTICLPPSTPLTNYNRR